jgi:hypothetical protein
MRGGGVERCDRLIPPGYVVAEHDNFPGEQMCLQCMVATVREHLREKALD